MCFSRCDIKINLIAITKVFYTRGPETACRIEAQCPGFSEDFYPSFGQEVETCGRIGGLFLFPFVRILATLNLDPSSTIIMKF